MRERRANSSGTVQEMTRASAIRARTVGGVATESARDRVFGLDLLRAAAITMVVFNHFTVVAGRIFDFPVSRHVRIGGTYGVELFFVLSGFLIGSLLLDIVERNPDFRSWRIFMVRRWMRTIPLYVLWVAILFLLWPPADDWMGHALSYLTFTQNFAWPISNWFGVSWTLSVEEWFYLLFSGVLIALAAIARRNAVPIACAAFIVVPTVLRLAFGATEGDLDAMLRKVVIFRLDAIAYGVAAVWCCRHWPVVARRWKGVAIAVGTVLVVSTYLAGQSFWPITLSVAPLGLALLLPGAAALRSAPAIVEVPIRWISERSYAMYMVHLTIVAAAARAVTDGRLAAGYAIPLALIVTLVLSDLSCRYFEKPILRHRPPQFAPPRGAVAEGEDAIAEASAAAASR